MNSTIRDEFDFLPKSNVKAGEGSEDGRFPFFTSSDVKVMRINTPLYDEEAVILGTGGKPSCNYFCGEFSVSTDNFVLSSKGRILPKFLYYFLRTDGLSILDRGFKGAGLKHISKEYVQNIVLPLISRTDQEVIIDELDTIVRCIESSKSQISLLDEQVKSLFNEMFGDPVENNKRWPQKPLKALGTLERGKSKHRPRNDPKLLDGPYPLIQTGDVSNARTFITKHQSTYSELGLSQSRMWEKGTLCITIAANIAQTAIMTFDACFPDSVVGFLPFSEVHTRYMHEWFGFLQPILDGMATSVAQKNLNLETLGKVPVIVPPIELQESYVRKVEQIDKLRFINLFFAIIGSF